MTTLHISGLTFRVSSPSMWELVHDWPGVSILRIYNGRPCHAEASCVGGWSVHYRDFMHEVTREFASRDAAIEVLASRRAA